MVMTPPLPTDSPTKMPPAWNLIVTEVTISQHGDAVANRNRPITAGRWQHLPLSTRRAAETRSQHWRLLELATPPLCDGAGG